jgi:hypothetical protein
VDRGGQGRGKLAGGFQAQARLRARASDRVGYGGYSDPRERSVGRWQLAVRVDGGRVDYVGPTGPLQARSIKSFAPKKTRIIHPGCLCVRACVCMMFLVWASCGALAP